MGKAFRAIVKSKQLLRIVPGWLLKKLSNRQFLMAGAVIVGLWAGLAAVLLKASVHYLQELLKPLGQQYAWIYFVSPTIGILLTYIFIKYILNGELIRGTYHVLLAITKKSSILPFKETYSHLATSALTVGMGGSAGLESPIVQTGSAIGSSFAAMFSIGYRDRTLLVACGAAAGIATAFNAPIAGVLFALEVLLVDINVSAFIPLLIAGATGALCSKIILSEGIPLSFRQISDFNYHNVPYYILLGIVCGLISVFYIKAFIKSEVLFKKVFTSDLARLVAGGIFLGFLILLFPALFGEGYSSIKSLALYKPEQLFTGSPLYSLFVKTHWGIGFAILLVGLVKVLAVSFTLNAGGNGGNFAPALLVGACIGFSFAFLGNTIGVTQLPTANFCLVAMAGLLTGIFHAPLTAIFLIAEITGGYDLIIPLMIVSALSTTVSKYLGPYSLDEAKLSQMMEKISIGRDVHILSELSLARFIEKDFVVVRLGSNLRALTEAVIHSKRNVFPVVDDQGMLAGIIGLEDIREIMFDREQYDSLLVDQLMRMPVATASINDDMNLVMEKFDRSGVWNIPVLSEGTYLGFISKSSIFSNYRDRLKND
jgi:CIC family chloride channel protein